MAKLYSALNTSRHRGLGEQTHRLGDHWVEALVKSWEYAVEVKLCSDGTVAIWVNDLNHGNQKLLYHGPIERLHQGITGPLDLTPKPVAVKEPAKVTALEVDVQQFLKERA